MTRLAFTGARLIDPASGLDRTGTLVVRDGAIEGIADAAPEGAQVVGAEPAGPNDPKRRNTRPGAAQAVAASHTRSKSSA